MTDQQDLPYEFDDPHFDGGWFLVQWKDGRRTYFRHRNEAEALLQQIDAVAAIWTPRLLE